MAPISSLAAYGTAAVVAVLTGLSSVLLESALPTMIVGVDFTPLTLVWAGARLILEAIAPVCTYRRYQREQDALLGYVALFLVLFAFGELYSNFGVKRYDIWWYGGRLIVSRFAKPSAGYSGAGASRVWAWDSTSRGCWWKLTAGMSESRAG